jgi:hypothetical protein
MVIIKLRLWILNQNRSRNRNFSKVETGTAKNHYGSNTDSTELQVDHPASVTPTVN